MKYICTESFSVEMFDDDGFLTGEYLDINAGEEYETEDSSFRIIGGPDTIRLECKNGNWLEITEETLNRFFIEAEG